MCTTALGVATPRLYAPKSLPAGAFTIGQTLHRHSNSMLITHIAMNLDAGRNNPGEDVDDESSLPTAIRNLIGTTHVMEFKSHTYYEYGTFESFTCWKINPSEMVDDAELEDSDVDEVFGPVKDSDKCNADGALDKKKKKRGFRYIEEDFECEYIMNGCESKKLLKFHHLTYKNNDGEDEQKQFTLQIS
ncbi:hypothetical protein Tco_0726388 [Tanacetum coccineum]|uniref:Uncharacterized protein n=1 Tax=Tanacetum coccineum TaxID=301880 RepID=A0ABQ4YHT5_9ASTR